ncbi:hypothetical protein [Nocardia abscessus]|uniref:hypothetical protein n=1 Tax=Nocardia abscessus TaxID=120957 RepID=UPI0024560151|nr:hypothetical protein [Nocardia abscessus]
MFVQRLRRWVLAAPHIASGATTTPPARAGAAAPPPPPPPPPPGPPNGACSLSLRSKPGVAVRRALRQSSAGHSARGLQRLTARSTVIAVHEPMLG